MRPLPRLFAFTDAGIRTSRRAGATAAAIASLGSPVALVARDHAATGAELTAFAAALHVHTRSLEASLFVSSRPDLAAAIGAQGVQLRAVDLPPREARLVFTAGWVGRSVHSVDEARVATDEEADYVVAGPIYETASHQGMTPWGISLIERIARLGIPVVAIGGMTPERAREVCEGGAWGVAAISALWKAARPGEVAAQMLEPWT